MDREDEDAGLADVVAIGTALRWSHTKAMRILNGRTWQQLHNDILRALLLTSDEQLLTNLLSILQENSGWFHSTPELVYKTWDAFIELLDHRQLNYDIRGSILLATTTLLLEVDALLEFPSLLEQFVERLYNLIVNVNQKWTVLYRQMALACLQEMEMFYPGLLHEFVFDVLHARSPLSIQGLLFSLYSTEASHIRQDYQQLLLLALSHATSPRFVEYTRRKKQKEEEEKRQAEEAGASGAAASKNTREKTTVFFEVDSRVVAMYQDELISVGTGGVDVAGGAGSAATGLVGSGNREAALHASQLPLSPQSGSGLVALALPTPVMDKLKELISTCLEEIHYFTPEGVVASLNALSHIVGFVFDLDRLKDKRVGGGSRPLGSKPDPDSPAPIYLLQLRERAHSLLQYDNMSLMHLMVRLGDRARLDGLVDLENADMIAVARQIAARVYHHTAKNHERYFYSALLSHVLGPVKWNMRYNARVDIQPLSAVDDPEFHVEVRDGHFAADRAGKGRQGHAGEDAEEEQQRQRSQGKEEDYFHASNPNMAAAIALSLYPSAFDSTAIKDIKLQSLLSFYELPPPASIQAKPSFTSLLLTPPDNLFDFVTALDDCVYYPPESPQVRAVFRFLFNLLVKFHGRYLQPCKRVILRFIRHCPHFVPNVTALLRKLDETCVSLTLRETRFRLRAVLRSLTGFLLSTFHRESDPASLVTFVGLISEVVRQNLHSPPDRDGVSSSSSLSPARSKNDGKSVKGSASADSSSSSTSSSSSSATESDIHDDPIEMVLKILFRCVSGFCEGDPARFFRGDGTFLSGVRGGIDLSVSYGMWQVGHEVLAICKQVMLSGGYPMSVIRLLRYLVASFDDVEIRDRAAFYVMLLSHCSQEVLVALLGATNSAKLLVDTMGRVKGRGAQSSKATVSQNNSSSSSTSDAASSSASSSSAAAGVSGGGAGDSAAGTTGVGDAVVGDDGQVEGELALGRVVIHPRAANVIQVARTLHEREIAPWSPWKNALGSFVHAYVFYPVAKPSVLTLDRAPLQVPKPSESPAKQTKIYPLTTQPSYHKHLPSPAPDDVGTPRGRDKGAHGRGGSDSLVEIPEEHRRMPEPSSRAAKEKYPYQRHFLRFIRSVKARFGKLQVEDLEKEYFQYLFAEQKAKIAAAASGENDLEANKEDEVSVAGSKKKASAPVVKEREEDLFGGGSRALPGSVKLQYYIYFDEKCSAHLEAGEGHMTDSHKGIDIIGTTSQIASSSATPSKGSRSTPLTLSTAQSASSSTSETIKFPREMFGVVVQFEHTADYHPVEPVILPFLTYFDPLAGDKHGAPGNKKAAKKKKDKKKKKKKKKSKSTKLGDEEEDDEEEESEEEEEEDGWMHHPSKKPERFPYVYRFTVSLLPRVPVPGMLKCSLLFNDQQGNTCRGSLHPVKVFLHDLFLPVPVPAYVLDKYRPLLESFVQESGFDLEALQPASLRRDSSAPSLHDGTRLDTLDMARAVLFEMLWSSILHRPAWVFVDEAHEGVFQGLRGKLDPSLASLECAESVKCLRMSQSRVLERIQTYLHQFVVVHMSEGAFMFCVSFFLGFRCLCVLCVLSLSLSPSFLLSPSVFCITCFFRTLT